MTIQIHRFLPLTTVEGPGKRACIWVQGCPIHCKGCGVPWTWNPNKGTTMTIEEVWELIVKAKENHGIEGVTFLGGEPFEQAPPLAEIGRRAQSKDLSVMVFSGYYKEELEQINKPGWQSLYDVADIFIDGPFELEMNDTCRPWVGSTNQRIHFLTKRYQHLKTKLISTPNKLEVYLHKDGTVAANGMVPPEIWKKLFHNL